MQTAYEPALAGLTERQVIESRARHGANQLTHVKQQGFFMKFIEDLNDPMIKILLVALAINLLFALGGAGWYESAGIALAVLLSTWVSTASKHRSETAFQKLQEEEARVNCRVLRRGSAALVPMAEVVVGDLVLLESGERVPADGELIRGELDVDQSPLNGETKEAHKLHGHMDAALGLNNPSMLLSGCMVCAGEGVMRVSAVGSQTMLGQLAGEIQLETRESPLQLRLSRLAGAISRFGIAGAVLVALADLFNIWLVSSGFSSEVMAGMVQVPGLVMGSILHAITLAVTVIVVAVPEGLPMMITVVLSANMRRMLRDHVLVRKPAGVETAGNIDLLMTDKTGTLTEGRFSVACVLRGDGTRYDSADAAARDAGFWRVLFPSLEHNNAASMIDGEPAGGNTTDRALKRFVAGALAPALSLRQVGRVPFTSDNKYMATEVAGDLNATLIKGAPERLLPHCVRYYDAQGRVQAPLNRLTVERAARQMAGEGMRVLAAATGAPGIGENFRELSFVALIGVRDPLRAEASQSVRALEKAGIQVIMITGDGPETAEAIAREAGLLRDKGARMLTSAELAQMSDAQLTRVLPDLRVVSRALPVDKSRLVDVAQGRGSVVGMTGDGVNDSPALKKADIGFAMGSGTEVAKEAGDIVILDDNLSSIVRAVLYGRTIFRSIRKFIVFQLTVNLCAMAVSIIAPIVGYDAPVTVMQMLWINMVMDTLAGLAFSGEPALKRYLDERPVARDTPIVDRRMAEQIGVCAAYTTLLCLWLLLSPWARGFFRPERGPDIILTAFFAVFVYAGTFNAFSARTHSLNLLDHILGNKGFVAVMAFVFAVQTALIYLGGSLLRAYGLTAREWLVCVALSLSVVPADLIRKALNAYLLRRRGA
ncbi:calcium-translocating P-type ATPase, PMCA-type [Bacillota bacterium Meth-B3]